jgi:hypothetical protein
MKIEPPFILGNIGIFFISQVGTWIIVQLMGFKDLTLNICHSIFF